MAGDWVKMRVRLKDDPKVICMADFLAEDRWFMNWLTEPVGHHCNNSAYEHVTRNVTVALCVTGLLQIWGMAREQGQRNDLDLEVSHCGLSVIDEICGVPSFGLAMQEVGWLIIKDGNKAVFPKFFAEKQNLQEMTRSSNAARQARFRERRRNAPVTSNGEHNVTRNVTDNVINNVRGEERREENKTPHAPQRGESRSSSEQIEIPTRRRGLPTLTRERAEELAAEFNRFWVLYPRRVKKDAAWSAWQKLNPSADLVETILAAAQRQKLRGCLEPRTAQDGRSVIPHASTWINGRRWQDEDEPELVAGSRNGHGGHTADDLCRMSDAALEADDRV